MLPFLKYLKEENSTHCAAKFFKRVHALCSIPVFPFCLSMQTQPQALPYLGVCITGAVFPNLHCGKCKGRYSTLFSKKLFYKKILAFDDFFFLYTALSRQFPQSLPKEKSRRPVIITVGAAICCYWNVL